MYVNICTRARTCNISRLIFYFLFFFNIPVREKFVLKKNARVSDDFGFSFISYVISKGNIGLALSYCLAHWTADNETIFGTQDFDLKCLSLYRTSSCRALFGSSIGIASGVTYRGLRRRRLRKRNGQWISKYQRLGSSASRRI